MKPYLITVRTASACITYTALASSSAQAALDAVDTCAPAPCGITVHPTA
jgi:hypothetical protein